MRDDLRVPDLTFPDVEYGESETPWDLRVLLYRGGAAARHNLVAEMIADGNLGDPQLERLALVTRLHEEIKGELDVGGGRETAHSHITHLRIFAGWADRTDHPLNLHEVVDAYCAWADSLVHRTRIKKAGAVKKGDADRRPLGERSAYSYGANVGALLDRVLQRSTNVIELTRLRMPSRRKTATGVQQEKQNLEHTFAFGHLLQDICDGLTVETVLEAALPVRIKLRSGQELVREGGTHAASLAGPEASLGERYPVVNLRIEAELMMFIGQTGMNLAQAQNLELRHFFYVSHLDGYQVKDRKERRGGTVLFEVFKDYKSHFERYLTWRRQLFSHSTRLFPFARVRGARPEARFQGERLRTICGELHMPYISPRSLRGTRVNWMLRKTADPELTAEMAQHTKEMLLGVYARPSLHRTMVEATHFWAKADPRLAKTQAVAPGDCTGQPKAIPGIPKEAPRPDCARGSGCLWCENHRDIDSQDYVWALASFKHVKVIELSKVRSPHREDDVPPARHAVDRLNEKLGWFQQSNAARREWVVEAQARIDEGDFHPDWHHVIAEQEGTT